MGRRELLDVILPPFETAVASAGAGSVMNSYSDVDGVPAGADRWLLTELLRDELGLHRHRRLRLLGGAVPRPHAPDRRRRRATPARTPSPPASTSSCPTRIGFGAGSSSRSATARSPRQLVDRAARRVLTQKAELGLLDPDGRRRRRSPAPPTSTSTRRRTGPSPASWPSDRSCCSTPGSALPLLGAGRPQLRRVAVVGPCAADGAPSWAATRSPTTCCPASPASISASTSRPRSTRCGGAARRRGRARAGLRRAGRDRSGFAAAVDAARDADLCVAFVGDRAGLFGRGTSGEGCDAEDLRLPGVQADLLDALLVPARRSWSWSCPAGPTRSATSRPRRRPRPGVHARRGGRPALAGVLSGRVPPGGKLPVQIPRTAGGQPSTYLQPPLGAETPASATVDPTPAVPVRPRPAYTRFELADLRLRPPRSRPTERSGDGAGGEHRRPRGRPRSVQLYLRDVVAAVARPVRQLAGFARVHARPDEAVDVAVPAACRPDRFHRPALRRDRRTGRPGDPGRHLGDRPPVSRHGTVHRGTARGGARPAAHDPGDRRPAAASPTPRRRGSCLHDGALSRAGRATLATVAASAGVSIATVSKVVNGRTDVGAATRARSSRCCASTTTWPAAGPARDRQPTVELCSTAAHAYSPRSFRVCWRRPEPGVGRDQRPPGGQRDRGRAAAPGPVTSRRPAGGGHRCGRRPDRRDSPPWPARTCRWSSSTRSTCRAAG